MPDLSFLSDMVPVVAQNKAREQMSQQQLRQAQAQSLIQEVLKNQQMLPLEMQGKEAYTNFLNAQADKMRRDPQDVNAERIAKAEALRNLAKQRQARGMLETALAMPEGRNELLDKLIAEKQLPDEIVQRLRPSDRVNVFTNENLNNIIRSLTETDPEASKTLRETIRGDVGIQREEMRGRTARDVQEMRNTLGKELQSLKNANGGKPLTESQVMGMLLQKVASGDITAEELKALDVAQILRASSTTAKQGIAPVVSPEGNINLAPSQQKPSEVAKPKLTPEQLKKLEEL